MLLVLYQVSTSYFVRIVIQISCGLLVVRKGGVGVVRVTVGIGGSIDYVQGSKKQITPTNYEIWGKLGVSF